MPYNKTKSNNVENTSIFPVIIKHKLLIAAIEPLYNNAKIISWEVAHILKRLLNVWKLSGFS